MSATARLLELLSLLQTPREWPGPELARRLEVSERTVRNDVERLRDLGYPVEATRGSAGGYRLAAGAAMPPLLLDDDEAVAITVGLRTALTGSIAGMEDNALRALAKLQQVLPTRLRSQVDALQATHLRVGAAPSGSWRHAPVDVALITQLAAAARDHEVVTFEYADHGGTTSERRVEPYRLVSMGRRWYLVAYDLHREDWRTFRIDRSAHATGVRHRFRPRPLPADDVAAWVARRTRSVRHQVVGTVRVASPAADAEAYLGNWALDSVEVIDEHTCLVRLGGNSWPALARVVASLPVQLEVIGPTELLDAVTDLSRRLVAACAEHIDTEPNPPSRLGP